MENCNDNFWYSKKLTGKFLHLCDSLHIHTYIHYIHIILKSSVLKSEYLNPYKGWDCLRLNRLGWAVIVFEVGWRGHSFTIFLVFVTKTDLLIHN